MLARLGIAALVVEGQCTNEYSLLTVTNDNCTLINADAWSKKGLYTVYKELFQQFGQLVSICGVGIAAEHNEVCDIPDEELDTVFNFL